MLNQRERAVLYCWEPAGLDRPDVTGCKGTFYRKLYPGENVTSLPTIHWLWFSVTVCNIWLSSSVSPSEMEYFSCLPAKGILLTLDKRLGNSEHCCLSSSAVTHMLVTETGAVRETGSPDFLVSM